MRLDGHVDGRCDQRIFEVALAQQGKALVFAHDEPRLLGLGEAVGRVAVLRHDQHGHAATGEQLQHLGDLFIVRLPLTRGQAVGVQDDGLCR